MNIKKSWTAVVKVLSTTVLLSIPFIAKADLIGFYESGASNSPAAAISAAGHTPVELTSLSAADLVAIDVLWILNGINSSPDAQVTGNVGAIESFVQGGGVLSFHDRTVNQGVSASTYIPGAGGVNFVNDFSANIDILAANAVTAGLDDTSLDGGNFSNHGYADLASLPAGAVPVLSNGNADQIVDFYFGLGSGFVYYSTIPLDFYLGRVGTLSQNFRTYAAQEGGFQASLANAVAPVSIPGSITLFGIGLLGLSGFAAHRRRQQSVQA